MEQKQKDQGVEEIVRQIYETYPVLLEKFGEHGRKHTAEDNYHHLDHQAARAKSSPCLTYGIFKIG